tara:strand:- start:418 stop:621 length:204 start_codon:yes stop_codon:yes gene_type:complete
LKSPTSGKESDALFFTMLANKVGSAMVKGSALGANGTGNHQSTNFEMTHCSALGIIELELSKIKASG